MRVYLDNCSFNRPFDDQSQLRIQLEAEAKLFIQSKIRDGQIELAWSYILDFENQANPFAERREAVESWKKYATVETEETQTILEKAQDLAAVGLKNKDALHIACAIEMQCDYFVMTDDRVLKRKSTQVDAKLTKGSSGSGRSDCFYQRG